MNEVKILNSGEKFGHASVGSVHAFEGKQFFKDATGATSCEISFGTLPTGAEVPFFHSHKANEENYRSMTRYSTSPKVQSFVSPLTATAILNVPRPTP